MVPGFHDTASPRLIYEYGNTPGLGVPPGLPRLGLYMTSPLRGVVVLQI